MYPLLTASLMILLLPHPVTADPMLPVVLLGETTADGDLILEWTAPLGTTPDGYILTRTVVGELTSTRITLDGHVTTYTERLADDSKLVAFAISWLDGNLESTGSNPFVAGWPRCQAVTVLPTPALREECLFPLPPN